METTTYSTKNAVEKLREAGIDVNEIIRGNTYRDSSTVVVVPTLSSVPTKVVHSWLAMQKPLNAKWSWFFVDGDEVSVAYNRTVETILTHEVFSKFKYILTLEADNIIPQMASILLLNAMHENDYDAVAGLYHMKSPIQVSLAFGREGERDDDGRLSMQPIDLTDDILNNRIVPVNGVPMGCTLWKMELFRDMEAPWFKTQTRLHKDGIMEIQTQDLYFCSAAREKGKRFAVDCRVKVGHLDVTTGEIY